MAAQMSALRSSFMAPAQGRMAMQPSRSAAQPAFWAPQRARFIVAAATTEEGSDGAQVKMVDLTPSNPLPIAAPVTLADGTSPNGPELGEAMAFAGPAPEIINGRLAMLGFVAALGAELATGQGVLKQWSEEPTLINITFILFIVASLIPILKNSKPGSVGPFTPQAELLNGRAAMLGFAALLAVEFMKKSALF